VPSALVQQHTFRLVDQDGPLDAQLARMRSRADWLADAGFDFFSTENGTTEFTHPDPTTMLAYLDELARHLDEAHGAPVRIKIHCSTGQTADGFVDPVTGAPLDFNHLPSLADARMGVMPHTVQMYGLDDPAPTYGNEDFAAVRAYLEQEAGRREVVWHPETAYWVSYDVDVPLFLPIYGQRRLADLRSIARREDQGLVGRGDHAGARIDGQSFFSSGWEWGYWLNDVVAARAAWDPRLDVADERAAFAAVLGPVARALGAAAAARIVDVAFDQADLLIEGRVDGAAPSSIVRRSGQAYLQGVDAYDDLPDLADDFGVAAPVTQPDKLGLVEMRNPIHLPPSYTGEIDGLLEAMRVSFGAHAAALAALSSSIPAPALPLYADLDDALSITALRARQVRGLYEYVDRLGDDDASARLAHLADARAALDEAAVVVERREASYRVPPDRIAGWRDGPTAYEYGYLWSVRALYYWWRDEGKAVDGPSSPCYLNLVNPADVALGEGAVADGAALVRDLTEAGALSAVTECVGAPSSEPVFPHDDLRARP
jgi:hypothetical protein